MDICVTGNLNYDGKEFLRKKTENTELDIRDYSVFACTVLGKLLGAENGRK